MDRRPKWLYIGRRACEYYEVHGGFGYGERNEDDERILEIGVVMGLAIGNTWFQREENRLVTFESGG